MNTSRKIYSRLKLHFNQTFNDLLSIVGMNKQFFKQARGARIVLYHGICKAHATRFNTIFLQQKTFEAHLKFYKKYFHIISLDDYYNKKFSKDRFNICIAFDDGFANNYKYVLPLMNKYKMPVTFFITSIRDAGYDILWNDFLALAQKYGPQQLQFQVEEFYKNKHKYYISKTSGINLKDLLRAGDFDKKAALIKYFEPMLSFRNNKHEEDYWLQMTKDEIKMIAASPFAAIGSHGYYHNDLTKISIDKAKDEMVRSKQWLQNITGKEITAIAFPYGDYSKDVLAEAKSAGYKQLLATDFIFPEDYADDAMRERFTVNPFISVGNQMIAIIKGKYESQK